MMLVISIPGSEMIRGNEAIKSPAAGVGSPLKEYCCPSSILNFASLHAAAQGISRAGKRNAIDTSRDRKSTRLNSSHSQISYAVFCLKKKKKKKKIKKTLRIKK